jgi:hypothetical protein
MIAPTEDPDQETAQDVDNEDDEESSESAYSPPTPEFSQRGAKVTLQARVPRCRWMEFEADSDGICGEQFRLWEGETIREQVCSIESLATSGNGRAILASCSSTSNQQADGCDVEGPKIQRRGNGSLDRPRHRRPGNPVAIRPPPPRSTFDTNARDSRRSAPLVMESAEPSPWPLSLNAAQQGVLLVDEIETAIHKGRP